MRQRPPPGRAGRGRSVCPWRLTAGEAGARGCALPPPPFLPPARAAGCALVPPPRARAREKRLTDPAAAAAAAGEPVGDEGAVQVSELLQQPDCRIRHLDLQDAQISDEGAMRLADGLELNRSLRTLKLSRRAPSFPPPGPGLAGTFGSARPIMAHRLPSPPALQQPDRRPRGGCGGGGRRGEPDAVGALARPQPARPGRPHCAGPPPFVRRSFAVRGRRRCGVPQPRSPPPPPI